MNEKKKNQGDPMAYANEVLHCYSELASCLARMVERAHDKQWGELPALELHCAELVERLKTLPAAESLAPAQREQARGLIGRIRADQDQVMRMVRPQLAQLLSRMGSLHTQKNLEQVYGPRH